MSNFHPQVLQLKAKVEELRSGLMRCIQGLPDNSRVRSLGSGCFTMSIKDTLVSLKTGAYRDGTDKRELMSNLCPTMHDFKHQYRKIAIILNRQRLEDIEKTIHRLIFEEAWGHDKFHPDVIKNLKTLWEAE